ncbi:hypothetical protein Aduo_002519 [Ancylostoma duodenale]
MAQLVACLVWVQAIIACTFTKRSGNFNAAEKYEILLGSEELCLTACYEESDCTYVEYYQGSCTVYKYGGKGWAGHGNVFEFDRPLSRSCSRRMQVADPTVKFETIISVNTDNRKCSGSPNPATAINVFQGRDSLRFYSTDKSILSDGTAPHRRFLWLSLNLSA